jgi:multicomponent Na+:H+ antiporter subunit G
VRTAATDILLAVAVMTSWLAATGLVRLRTPLDRLHCVTFLNVSAGLAVLIAALVTEGATTRTGKLLLLVLAVLWIGAALANATGRALWLRENGR